MLGSLQCLLHVDMGVIFGVLALVLAAAATCASSSSPMPPGPLRRPIYQGLVARRGGAMSYLTNSCVALSK